VQRNKAIVGDNAFAHEAGIHQHGVIADRSTYEIIHAEDVGWRGRHLVIGKHSGMHAVGETLKARGFDLSREQLREVTTRARSRGPGEECRGGGHRHRRERPHDLVPRSS
jgi:2-isopropylmalate synthase